LPGAEDGALMHKEYRETQNLFVVQGEMCLFL